MEDQGAPVRRKIKETANPPIILRLNPHTPGVLEIHFTHYQLAFG
jgi:hypothetical protein